MVPDLSRVYRKGLAIPGHLKEVVVSADHRIVVATVHQSPDHWLVCAVKHGHLSSVCNNFSKVSQVIPPTRLKSLIRPTLSPALFS